MSEFGTPDAKKVERTQLAATLSLSRLREAATLDLTEKEWAAQVSELAQLTGWRRYHTFLSKRSQPGFPDEVLVRDRVIFLELKTEKGKLSPAQRVWLTDLSKAGAEAYIARPSDLEWLAAVLTSRVRPTQVFTFLEERTKRELQQPP